MPSIREYARAYYDAGLPPVPLHQGKPLTAWRAFIERRPSWGEIERLPWSQADGVALVLGHAALANARWWVLDIETAHVAEAEAWLDQHCPGWREGLVAESQSGGLHVYCLTLDPPGPSRRCAWGDVKAKGGLVYAPPSRRFKPGAIHDYRWLVAPDVERFGEEAPVWACFLNPAAVPGGAAQADGPPTETTGANGQGPSGRFDVARVLAGVPHGERNTALFTLACRLRRADVPEEWALRLVAEAAARCDPPWGELPTDRESVEALVSRVYARYPTPAVAVLDRHGTKDRQRNRVAIYDGFGDLSRAPAEIRPRLLSLATVQPEPVRWLWPGRIPLGKLTILDGDPGLGKSLLAIDLAARVSTGRVMPDGSRGDLAGPASVVLLSAEDDPADTIRPRLDAAGGDPSRVAVLTTVEAVRAAEDGSEQRQERGVTLLDIEALRQAILATGAKLVVIDPVTAFVGKTDTHVDAQVRQLLRPLAELAQETGAAILVIRHLNKSGAANPLYRGGGSIAFVGAARAGLLVARDPDDATGRRSVLAVTKSNLAEPAPALAYVIEAVAHAVAGVGQAPRIAWQGESPHTARTLLVASMEEPEEERTAVEEAKAFLRDLLAHGPVEANRVRREARQAGISPRTLDRAKTLLGVRSVRTGFGSTGAWQWTLPPATASLDTVEGDGAAAGTGPAAADLRDSDGSDDPDDLDGDPAIGGGPVASADTGSIDRQIDRQKDLRSPAFFAGDLWRGTDTRQAASPATPADEPVAEPMAGPGDGPGDRARALALAERAGYPRFWSRVNHCWYTGPEGWHLLTQAANDAAVQEALDWLQAHHPPPPRAGPGHGEAGEVVE